MNRSMTVRRIILSALVTTVFFAGCCAAAEEAGFISGTVRDAEGKPLAGADVTLTSDQPPSISESTTSGREGTYRFTGLRPGKYELGARKSGFASTAREAIEISAISFSASVDFKLTPQPLSAQSSAVESNAKMPPETKTPPKFQAAGVRGVIDPGGYSAGADAAATSGLIEGMSGMKRAGHGMATMSGASWPCGMGPQLKAAVAANPNQGEANRRLGEFYLAHSQPNRSISFLQKAREIDRADDLASRDLAAAWIESGQFESARQLLAGLAEQHPTLEIQRLLARAEEGLGLFPQAAQQYRFAADLEPSEENFFDIGYDLILGGQPTEADNAFRLGLKQNPQSIQLLIGLGAAEFLQGHRSEGLVLLLQASDLYPSDPRPYSFLASVSATSQPENDRVRHALKRFLELAPGNAEAPYFYAISISKGEHANEAAVAAEIEALLNRAITLDPAFAKAHLQLGQLYSARRDYKSAAMEYEATVRLAPSLKEAHYLLSGVYRRTGKAELAAREMDLFRLARTSEISRTGDSEVGMEKLISVMTPQGRKTNSTDQCPEAVP